MAQVIASSAGIAGWSHYARPFDIVAQDSRDDERKVDRLLNQQDLLERMGVIDEVKSQLPEGRRVRFDDVGYHKSGLHIFEVSDPIVDQEV